MPDTQTFDINKIDTVGDDALIAAAAPSFQMTLIDEHASPDAELRIVNVATGFHSVGTLGASKHFPFAFTVNAYRDFTKAVCSVSVSGFHWKKNKANVIDYRIEKLNLKQDGQVLIVEGSIYCHDDNASVTQLSYNAVFAA